MNDGELVGMLTYERQELTDEIEKLRKDFREMVEISHDFSREAQELRKENASLRVLNGREFRQAVELACDERLDQQKHRIRELEAEVERLRAERALALGCGFVPESFTEMPPEKKP